MTNTSDSMAERFVQHSENADGSAARSFELMNDNTKKRIYVENSMKGMGVKNKNLNNIITTALTSYPDQLSSFVIAHGESPIKYDPVKLALQAVILRAKDIAKQATSTDSDDDTALADIENAEMAAQDINAPDSESTLSTDAQAAMKVAMDHMRDVDEANGGNGKLSDILSRMENASIAKGNANYFDLPSLATIPVDTGTINPLTGMPTITAGPAPTTNTSGIVNSGSGSGILDTIDSILNGIGHVATGVKDAANSVSQAGNAVQGAIGNVGASTLEQYMKRNSTTILISVLAIAVLLFIVIYAAKKV